MIKRTVVKSSLSRVQPLIEQEYLYTISKAISILYENSYKFLKALTNYVDIHSPPRVNLLNELIQYCTGTAKDELIKLCGVGSNVNTEESKAHYQNWVADSRRSIAHILEDLGRDQVSNIPIDHLLELLPRLQPRYYSIASSPKVLVSF